MVRERKSLFFAKILLVFRPSNLTLFCEKINYSIYVFNASKLICCNKTEVGKVIHNAIDGSIQQVTIMNWSMKGANAEIAL